MKTASAFLSLFVSWAGVLFFGCAALAAIRLAIAETISRQDTTDALGTAIAFEWPASSAELEERLAELDPIHARDALERGAQANPRSSAAWIALGLWEDANGNRSSAERSLREAARIDHQYLPAWTLANFYFRRADREQFWVWADCAASLVYDDFRPLLQLCDQFEPEPRRMLAHFQDTRRLRPPYLDFLIGASRLDAAQQVARGMAGERANDPRLIGMADLQLRAGNAVDAMELWNVSSGFPSLDPPAGKILTNGDLARAPLNLGFDWRMGQAEGVFEKWEPSELSFTFSGSQPEACVLLEQTIVLVPRHFRLRFDYMANAGQGTTGVHWALDDIEGPQLEPAALWREGAFNLPRAHGLRNLKLFYRREPGTTRTEGRLEIRNLRLEASL